MVASAQLHLPPKITIGAVKVKKPKAPTLYVPVRIKGALHWALLDTGAEASLMGSMLA